MASDPLRRNAGCADGASRIRVLFAMPSLRSGGSEKVVSLIADRLDRARFDVHFLLLDDRDSLTLLANPETHWYRYRHSSAMTGLPALIRTVWRLRPAIVFSTFNWFNILLCALRPCFPRGVCLICRQSSLSSVQLDSYPLPGLHHAASRMFLRNADAVVCQTEFMKADLCAHSRVSVDRVRVIGNPVLASVGPAVRRQERYEPETLELLCVANLRPEKRLPLLVRIVGMIPDRTVRLTIVGEGEERASVEAAVDHGGLASRVRLVGHVDDPSPFYRDADALLVVSAYEGFPNVVLEAGMHGLPTLAFRAPGVSEEIIRPGVTGDLIAEGDLQGFASAILALRQQGKYDSARIQAYVRDHFGVEKIVREYERTLSEVAERCSLSVE